jgi:uncharacterized membrane protein YccC
VFRATAAGGRRRWIDAVERYLGSDPGGERFRSGLNAIVAWLAAVGVAALLESVTHAFDVSSSAPGAGAANHTAALVVLMIGSTVALTAGFVVADATVRARAVTSLMAALGMWAGIAAAVAVHGDRLVALALLVIVPSAGAWFRRYGPRGFASTFTVHVGYLIGFLVAPQIGTVRLGWVGAVIGVSAVATYAVGLVFLPGHARAPQRMSRSYRARVRRVLTLTADLMDTSRTPAAERQLMELLRRQVVRLNETALVLDVQLAGSPSAANERLRRSLFDHERAVATLARLAQLDAHDRVHGDVRAYARALIVAAYGFDAVASLELAGGPTPHEVTGSIPSTARRGKDVDGEEEILERYGEAARALASALNPDVTEEGLHRDLHPADSGDLRRKAILIGGWLPGTAIVNALASARPGRGWRDRFGLSVSTRVAVQLAAALTLAVTLADLISPSHVLWAVVAVYVTFLGSASNHEQLYKAALRVAGTLVGVIVGGELAHLTSPHIVATLVVIALATFFMAYFGKINYALVVFAATLGVTQFYAQVGELPNTLLMDRVELTAVGAACAILVGLAVLPLRTVNAATLAVAGYFRALAQLLDGLAGPDRSTATNRPTTDTRVLDAAFHAATAALRPLTRTFPGSGKERFGRTLRLVNISHELGRAVVHDSAITVRTEKQTSQIAAASEHTAAIARMVADDLEQPAGNRAVRSGAAVPKTAKPGTVSLRTEIEGVAAVVTELAQIRGLAVPDRATRNSAARATSRIPG